jgi:hypothetical protein
MGRSRLVPQRPQGGGYASISGDEGTADGPGSAVFHIHGAHGEGLTTDCYPATMT